MYKSIRIGNKDKSVRIKSYILNYYSKMMGIDLAEAKKHAEAELEKSLSLLPSKDVTADHITVHLLVNTEIHLKGDRGK